MCLTCSDKAYVTTAIVCLDDRGHITSKSTFVRELYSHHLNCLLSCPPRIIHYLVAEAHFPAQKFNSQHVNSFYFSVNNVKMWRSSTHSDIEGVSKAG